MPHITEHPKNENVKKHEPTTLNCKADGIPVPSIEWFKDGDKVKNTGNRMILPSGSLFFLHVIHNKDTGLYWCSATNSVGTVMSHKALLSLACKNYHPDFYYSLFGTSSQEKTLSSEHPLLSTQTPLCSSLKTYA